MRRARELIERYAPTALSILLVGSTGTGKELLARHIHARSGRCGRFVGVNCGALPRDMADGLLFGHERGAFSGAVKRHRGHIECAEGGTLFLDELLSLSVEGQAKLLRALDTGEIQRLGEEVERYVDTRFVGAMQADVEEHVSRGMFRLDLYERLSGVVIELPPLIDRPGDVISLARHFAAQRGQVLEREALPVLDAHSWPGNVRELRHVIERAGCLVENGTLPAAAVREALALGVPKQQSGSRSACRREYLACEEHGWDTRKAATSLGIARSTLYYRLKVAGVSSRLSRKRWLEVHWNSMEFQRGAEPPSK